MSDTITADDEGPKKRGTFTVRGVRGTITPDKDTSGAYRITTADAGTKEIILRALEQQSDLKYRATDDGFLITAPSEESLSMQDIFDRTTALIQGVQRAIAQSMQVPSATSTKPRQR